MIKTGIWSSIIVFTLATFGFATPNARAALVDSLVNGSFEQAGSAVSMAYDWQNFGGGYARVTGGHGGSWSMRVQNATVSGMSGAYQRVDVRQTTEQPLFIGAYVKGSNIRLAPGSYFGASLYAEIHLTDGRTVYWNTVANSGTFDWRWIGFNTGTVSLVNAPIDYIFVVPVLINASGTAYFDDVSVQDFSSGKGAITLMFDDGPVNTYTVAKPLMDAYGLKGVVATVSSYVDDDPAYMTSTQLDELYRGGWEVMSHSVNHEDLTLQSPTQVRYELAFSKSALSRWNARQFATPYGAYSAYILGEGQRYYSSVRNFEQGSNPQGTFPYDVKVRGITTQTTAADVQNWVTEARSNGRWEVFVFHDIANTGDDAYHTPVSEFKQILETIASSGVSVETYSQALQRFTASK